MIPAALVALSLLGGAAVAAAEELPCAPESQFLPAKDVPEVDIGFCSEWNPEFGLRGTGCCVSKGGRGRKRRGPGRCSPTRAKTSFCDEMTDKQKEYVASVQSGKIRDPLEFLKGELKKRGEPQAFCSVNDGFLVDGRRLLSTPRNRIVLRSPTRCVDFGTDHMVAMLEHVASRVWERYSGPEFSRARIIVGDIAAPRGGCLVGRSGRKGHASHTSGQDADIGFFNPIAGRASEEHFSRTFDPATNWVFLKELLENPIVCIKRVFLDRRLIGKLAKVAKDDPLWPTARKVIQHQKHHRNHFHVRIGEGPGPMGCAAKDDDDSETADGDELESAIEHE